MYKKVKFYYKHCFLYLFSFSRQFKNFCSYLNYNPDILLVILSKGLIYVKNKFKEEVDTGKNELNFLLIDPLIKKSLVNNRFIILYKI